MRNVPVSQFQARRESKDLIPTATNDLLTTLLQTNMAEFATLAGFATPGSAASNLSKVLRKMMAKSGASPEAGKKGGARKRKAGKYPDFFSSRKLWTRLLT